MSELISEIVLESSAAMCKYYQKFSHHVFKFTFNSKMFKAISDYLKQYGTCVALPNICHNMCWAQLCLNISHVWPLTSVFSPNSVQITNFWFYSLFEFNLINDFSPHLTTIYMSLAGHLFFFSCEDFILHIFNQLSLFHIPVSACSFQHHPTPHPTHFLYCHQNNKSPSQLPAKCSHYPDVDVCMGGDWGVEGKEKSSKRKNRMKIGHMHVHLIARAWLQHFMLH